MNRDRQGIALVTALAILVVVGILVAGSFITTQLELGITRNDATSVQARYVAEAGLEKYKAALFQNYRYIEDILNDSTANPSRTACFNRMANGLDWNRDGTVELTWSNNRIQLANQGPVYNADQSRVIGTYDIFLYRDPNTPKEARGNSNRARATLRATVELNNTGVLEQAIFSGEGQANKFINGGTTIRGGIYVVGDPNNSTATVFNSNGNFSQLNDYDLTNNSRYDQMVYRVSSANRVADELCSTLRVEDGRVELNGSVKLGDPDNKLLGVHIGHDVSQDLIINTTLLDCTATKGVCTDDGPDPFDIDRAIAPDFPTLDSVPNSTEGCSLSSWRACIHRDAGTSGITVQYNNGSPIVTLPSNASGGSFPSSCETMLTSRTLLFEDTDIDCTANATTGERYGFTYTHGSPGSITVYGNVDFQGYNLQFNRDVEYYAKTYKTDGSTVLNATITAESDNPPANGDNTYGGDIDLNADMLTGTTGYDYYPNHVLAFVAENDVFQGGSQVMAPIYAGGTYRIVSDNTLIGSVVSNYFCTTGAGGSTNQQKKNNSKTSSDKCNAGQNSEVVYVNTGNNKPAIMRYLQFAGLPVFRVMSTEMR